MMDKKKFEEELKTVSNQVNKDVVKSILSDSISNEFGQPIGQRNLIIVMEELAELSQAVAKELRMKGDKINLLEEMADVQLALYYLQTICGVSDDALNRAINVKTKRVAEIVKEKGSFQ